MSYLYNKPPRHLLNFMTRLFPRPRYEYLLAGFAILFAGVFTAKGLLIHGNLGTAAFDLGIFDQAFWRYSRFLDNFNTVRGLPILGDHFSPIAFAFAPLYRLYPTIAWPIAIQAISVALGGVIFCITWS